MIYFLFHFELRFRFAYFTFGKILSKYPMVPRLPRVTAHRFGLSRYAIIDIIEFNTFWTYTAVLKQTEG